MRFVLSSSLLRQLRSLRARRGKPDDVEQREDAVLLDPGLGPSRYLAFDGRVLVDGRDWDDTPVREETDDDEAFATLVVGARKTGIEELLELLPPTPLGAVGCSGCHGRRWIVAGADVATGEPGEIVCLSCRGKGWVLPRPAER